MCRWVAYSGAPLFLEELLFKPDNSLIHQSLAAREAATTTNGDGFGVGWYGARETPGLYKSLRPAWNDLNLRDLAAHIESPVFMAHIRATSGTAVQRSNSHPFRHGKWLFVHNGEIDGFLAIKRDLMLAIAPDLFVDIEGTTDSEVMFYLCLTFGLESDPVAAAERMAGFVEATARKSEGEHPLRMTLGITDGRRLIAVRYATDGQPGTLYHSKSIAALKQLRPDLDRFSDDAGAVVSEPLDDLGEHWVEIPVSTAIVMEAGEVTRTSFQPAPPEA